MEQITPELRSDGWAGVNLVGKWRLGCLERSHLDGGRETRDQKDKRLTQKEKGLNKDFLKLTSCNTTGLIRSVDCLDRAYGIDRVAITIIRRVADPGDYHRGLTNALQIDKAPSHQAVDLMTIMPHVEATGILVHTPITHGHIITVVATGKQKITKEMALEALKKHPYCC